jgi:hypothetical protein
MDATCPGLDPGQVGVSDEITRQDKKTERKIASD